MTKVLRRFQPNLVPLVDFAVCAFYGTATTNLVEAISRLHQDAVFNRKLLQHLAAGRRTPDGQPVSLLRVLDIVAWHQQTQGCT